MQKRDNIEDLIRQNIDELNDNEPLDGHFARFEEKLNKQHKRKRKITFNVVWKVAAVIVFVLLAGNQALIYFSPNKSGLFMSDNKKSNISLSSLSSEYKEVEFYYTSSINSGIEQWNKLKNQGLISEEEQEMMNEELNDFETLHKNLQQDLQLNPNDERVINAMLEYYQAKLSVINLIVDKLNDVQKQNKNTVSELSAM